MLSYYIFSYYYLHHYFLTITSSLTSMAESRAGMIVPAPKNLTLFVESKRAAEENLVAGPAIRRQAMRRRAEFLRRCMRFRSSTRLARVYFVGSQMPINGYISHDCRNLDCFHQIESNSSNCVSFSCDFKPSLTRPKSTVKYAAIRYLISSFEELL